MDDNATIVFMFMGGVAIIGFIVLWIFDRDPKSKHGDSIHKHHHKSKIA